MLGVTDRRNLTPQARSLLSFAGLMEFLRKLRVGKALIHPGYDASTGLHDIALLFLS